MKKISFRTPYWDYDVTLIQVESDKDSNDVCRYLAKAGVSEESISSVRENIEKRYVNGGEVNWNSSTKRIIGIFYEFLTDDDKVNIYSHEKRHIEDRVLQHCRVDDIETSAYFAGYLGVKFLRLWNETRKEADRT